MHLALFGIRPGLGELSFPVGRVGKKAASRSVGNFLFFPNFLFHKLECMGEKGGTFFFFLNMKKKSALFSPLGRWTGNNFSFLDGLTSRRLVHVNLTRWRYSLYLP